MSRAGLWLCFGLLVAPMAFAQVPLPNELPMSEAALNALLEEDSGATYDQNHAKLIQSAEAVGALGDDLFGEQVNFYTGATSFEHTDLTVPGNGSMGIAVSRTLDVATDKFAPFSHSMGDWALDLPYIGGTFVAALGWVVKDGTVAGSRQRCSLPTSVATAQPPDYVGDYSAGFVSWQYWSGYGMHLPGGGDQPVLFRGDAPTAVPTTAQSYKWVTKNFWHLRCINLPNALDGEGFVALAPDGTEYTFSKMVTTPSRPTGKRSEITTPEGIVPFVKINRVEVRLYATKIKDRFGNEINYSWNGDRLATITSSSLGSADTPSVSFGYDAQTGRVTSATQVGTTLQVNYTYTAGGSLDKVVYADGKQWDFNLEFIYPRHYYDCGANPPGPRPEPVAPPGDNSAYLNWLFRCWDQNSPEYGYKRKLSGESASGTLTHPSGAVGTFTFQVKRHVRASVPLDRTNCLTYNHPGIPGMPDLTPYGEGEPWDFFCWTPLNFDVQALKQKQIAGTGIASTSQWVYDYDQYIAAATHPPGDYAPHTRKVVVKEPGGVRREFTFGNRYNINEGQLLQVETYNGHEGQNRVLRTINTYVLKEDLGQPAYPFPDRVGTNPLRTTDNIWGEWMLPMIAESSLQEGDTYQRQTQGFDIYANPLQVKRTGPLGIFRTDITTYENNPSKWVIGLPLTVVNADTNKQVSRTTYDPVKALPTAQFSFNRLFNTFDYHPDGSLWKAVDGRGLTTQLTGYVRGIPERIEFSDTTAITAKVNPLGRLEWTQNALSAQTRYGYDVMGRLTSVTYPGGESPWTPRALAFLPNAATPYQLPSGLWKQTSQTGNGLTSTYYDQLWRPILIVSEDTGDTNTRSFVVKRYDDRSREIFSSYPVASLSNYADPQMKGVKTDYDTLGRVTRTTADSELGPLHTDTEYLSGLRTQVTNPRGKITTTTYQAYDSPSYDAPILIQAPLGVTTTIERDVFGKPLTVTRSGPSG